MDDDHVAGGAGRAKRVGDRILPAIAATHQVRAIQVVRWRIHQFGRQRDDHLVDLGVAEECADRALEDWLSLNLDELLQAIATEARAASAGRNDCCYKHRRKRRL